MKKRNKTEHSKQASKLMQHSDLELAKLHSNPDIELEISKEQVAYCYERY